MLFINNIKAVQFKQFQWKLVRIYIILNLNRSFILNLTKWINSAIIISSRCINQTNFEL